MAGGLPKTARLGQGRDSFCQDHRAEVRALGTRVLLPHGAMSQFRVLGAGAGCHTQVKAASRSLSHSVSMYINGCAHS